MSGSLLGLRFVDAFHVIARLDICATWMGNIAVCLVIRPAKAECPPMFIYETANDLLMANAANPLFSFKKLQSLSWSKSLSLGSPDVLRHLCFSASSIETPLATRARNVL